MPDDPRPGVASAAWGLLAPDEGVVMVDKSPHASMSKKSGTTIKQKRAAKKAAADSASGMEKLVHPTKH
jgi:hypothetical protein